MTGSSYKVQRSTASIESRHGRYYRNNIIGHRLLVGVKGPGKAHNMGTYEVLTRKIQVPSPTQREN